MKNNFLKTGYTLLELTIVVAIVAVLSSAGFISYQNHVEFHRCQEGVHLLQAFFAAQKRFFVAGYGYTNDISRLDVENPVSSYFKNLTVNTTDPIVTITRQDDSYRLSINADGSISCYLDTNNACKKLGIGCSGGYCALPVPVI
jgi:prepilin-type N-terminal cleavage/methylation domain-containing protein